jgi:hypothetical protein
MSLFSHRKGLQLAQKVIQRESIDEDLRNRLWSGLKLCVWDRWSPSTYRYKDEDSKAVELLLQGLWLHYFKLPIDTLPEFYPGRRGSAYEVLRQRFFEAEWWQVYDFIEFVVKWIPAEWRKRLKQFINNFLESENAAYRIVDDEIVEITNTEEIDAIESAIDRGVISVREHLQRSLDLLSDRKNPDFRNSIKEAISAVESACRIVSGKQKATLTDCLRALKEAAPLHPAFEQALTKLYGYTSDEGGIRHALSEEASAPSYADAKFMLVAASAFVNYVWTKAAELNIKVN